MQRFIVVLGTLLITLLGFTFAANPSIVNHSYTVEGDDVKIFRTDNSDGGSVDINVQNPETNERLHFGTVKIEDQIFTYPKQWDGDQKIWMIPDDGGDEIQFTIQGEVAPNTNATRTVIPAVPKTGPSGNIIGIIIATLVIFGGYIYIKKRAGI